jgi:hypothetical protein
LTLALTGLTSLLVAAGTSNNSKAIVRYLKGSVMYQLPEGGDFKPVKTNQELDPGTTLRTGAGAAVYLSVNGLTSAVMMKENTTMILSVMTKTGDDSSTTLFLKGGTALGSVKKISANSDYNVKVPSGVAAIRGTDWQVTVTYEGDNTFQVVFTSVLGTITCTATVPQGFGGQSTQTLTTGQSWTISGTTQTSTTGVVTTVVTTVNIPVTLPSAAVLALQATVAYVNQIVAGPGTTTTTTTTTPTTVTGVTTVVPPTTNPSDTGGS